ncbi:24307_t:CDS:1, partial [Cetraspora pellucida]
MLFEFLNSYLKLPDCQALSRKVLEVAVAKENKTMHNALHKDQTGVTLTFDRWTNIKNKQLLGVIIITSEEKPY